MIRRVRGWIRDRNLIGEVSAMDGGKRLKLAVYACLMVALIIPPIACSKKGSENLQGARNPPGEPFLAVHG
jgi:hypothetical protein